MAEQQLKYIFNYYNRVAGRSKAMKIVITVKEHTAALGAMPYMASVELLLENEPIKYRSLVISQRYKAIYHVDEENDAIVIVDLWDCRQDPDTLRRRVVEMAEI
jgi:plasmid stabilization system protein ParE